MATVIDPDECLYLVLNPSNAGLRTSHINHLRELGKVSVYDFDDLIICCVKDALQTSPDFLQVLLCLYNVLETTESLLSSPDPVIFVSYQQENSVVGNKHLAVEVHALHLLYHLFRTWLGRLWLSRLWLSRLWLGNCITWRVVCSHLYDLRLINFP